jgi:protein-disulfide isomerase
MNKGTAIVGFFLCFLAGMGLMWGVDRSQGTNISAESASTLDQSDSPIPVTAKDPQMGSPTAPVTIVEFSDFQCPFCKRANPTVTQIQDTYGPQKVRVVWKNNPLPFHPHARPAADAAMTVFGLGGSKAFFKYKDLLFENQPNFTPENLAKWAGEVGVNEAKFKSALAAKTYTSKVDQDLALGSKIGVNGTPNFRINGVEVSGAQPYSKFKEVVDQQLAAAKELEASGTKPQDVYVDLTKKNFTAPPPENNQAQKQPEEDKTIWKVPVDKTDPVRGPADALVTIVEFSDFQCPFCKRAEGTIKQILSTYGKEVRIVWKNNPLPFHPRAKPAATLAWYAFKTKGNKAFWDVHDAIYESQPKLADDDLKAIADKFGVDWNTVKSDIDSDKFNDDFEQTIDLASDLNARGTPGFFINGYRLIGAQPFPKFKEVIDEQLAKAKALVAHGTPASKVYETIMETAKGPPPLEKKEVPPPTAQNPSMGPMNAPVVIQIWSDFQCPFCKRVLPAVQQVEQQFGKKVRLVWHDYPLPFHKNAEIAAEAAQAVFAQKGSAGFWKYHDMVYGAAQPDGQGIDQADLVKMAQSMGGIDMTKFNADLASHKYKAKIDADEDEGKKAGINGTPAFVINGYFVNGAQPFSAFKKAIEQALKDKHIAH